MIAFKSRSERLEQEKKDLVSLCHDKSSHRFKNHVQALLSRFSRWINKDKEHWVWVAGIVDASMLVLVFGCISLLENLEFTSKKAVPHPIVRKLCFMTTQHCERDSNVFGRLDYLNLNDEDEESDTDEHDGNGFINESGREVSNMNDKEMQHSSSIDGTSFSPPPKAASVKECG